MEINIVDILSNFGFPAFIAIYVLHSVNRALDKLTEAIYKLTIEFKTFTGGIHNANRLQ